MLTAEASPETIFTLRTSLQLLLQSLAEEIRAKGR